MEGSNNREIVFLLLQFLGEENMNMTARMLERESGVFFNMRFFEEKILNGEWDEVESYLSSFTMVLENRYSTKIFFEIRQQKYLEALDKHDKDGAIEILTKDLKVFKERDENLYKEMTMLLTLNNFREVDKLSRYRDAKSSRIMLSAELRRLIMVNPVFRGKLQFPSFQNARLRALINQGWSNGQHPLCGNPRPNPNMRSLFVDHICEAQVSSSVTVTNPLPGPMPRDGEVMTTGAPEANNMQIDEARPGNAQPLHVQIDEAGPSIAQSLHMQINEAGTSDARPLPMQIDEAGPSNARPLHMQIHEAGTSDPRPLSSNDYLPKTVEANLFQGSAVKSMDFHAVQPNYLLVGTITGDVSVWEVGCGRMVASRNFKVWDIGACSLELQAILANEYTASVTCIRWSSHGKIFGVAYSKHMVQFLSYQGDDDLRNHFEIEAHIGSVNDLAFYRVKGQSLFITCGDDETIKVWDVETGTRQYTFDGHNSPVYSVCPHTKGGIDFIISNDVDGKIKVWLYDNEGSRVDYEAPGRSCSTMIYNDDGTRLFSCGTNRDGESHMVEWDDTEGTLKRTYLGLGKQAVIEKVHFDRINNRFLAAGDEFAVKYWDMDNINLFCTVDADGGLPASPCIRFNKFGTMLAVSSENGVKILANADGSRFLRFIRDHTGTSSKTP